MIPHMPSAPRIRSCAAIFVALAALVGAPTRSVRANPATFGLTVRMSGDGTVTSSPDGITCTGGTTGCSADFTAGAPVVLTATPASGWRFYGWGSPCTGTGTCTVTMTEAKIVTLGFVRITPPLVTVSISGSGSVTSLPAGINCANTSGSTTCSSAFASGVSVQLTATPASGYQFYGWGGACTGAAAC